MTKRLPRLYVGSNLKMYKTIQQTVAYLKELQCLTADIPRDKLTLFILPSCTALAEASRSVNHEQILIGAQNMHWEEQGQYTGEISPLMLQEIDVDLVMVGHAERRQLFFETDEMVNRRLLASLIHGFTTLLCIGETANDKHYGISEERLRTQLKIALNGVEPETLSRLWVAYEPVWSIGDKGTVAEPSYVNKMHEVLRDTLNRLYGDDSDVTPVLYGGSVNQENAVGLIEQPAVDGLFIGRAAWEAVSFNAILRQTIKIFF